MTAAARHPAARTWIVPPDDRPAPPPGVDRINLRALIGQADRFEHHLVVCAGIGRVQLEIVTASEPLFFAHVNISDEYAVALPTGDPLVDGFPFRTFLSDPATGADVGRYNHRTGDLILHPAGLLHWPGRLRPPYEPMPFPPGMRRCGLSLVYCANQPTPATPVDVPVPPARAGDAKPYAEPAPRMVIAPIVDGAGASAAGVLARIADTALALVHRPAEIAPTRGGWVVVLAADAGSAHVACDLLRVADGARLDGTGIERALVLASDAAPPDAVPPAWTALPAPAFAPFEDAPPGALPIEHADLVVEAASPSTVRVAIGATTTEVPRYWLARLLFRVGLHGLRLGYLETYGGLFVDDHAATRPEVRIGVRTPAGPVAITVPRAEALALVERLYRAVAPPGYRERLT